MKIAFVYDAVYPWVKGGAEIRIYELGKRLSSQGHDVHLFGIKWWEGEDVIRHEGMTLHGVCQARELYVDGRRSIPEALVFAAKLFPPLMKEKFDLIDVSVFPYFSCFTVKAVSVLKKTPAVFTWHEAWGDYWYEYLGKTKGLLGLLIEKAVARISKNDIAVSDWTKDRLEALKGTNSKIAVLPNGVDLKLISEIKPAGKGSSDAQGGKIYDVIFAGRLIKEKNVDVLIKAISLLKKDFPEICCCIVGDGPERKALEKLTRELGVRENVIFEGFQEYRALIGKIKASKVLVLPSSREGFGMVVIEAFACGVPVVTVREKYNAAQGLVEDGVEGFVVRLEGKEIAKAVEKILQIENNYTEIASHTIKKAENFDWDILSTELLLSYKKLL
ncbi:TPA: glycosyltransferase family 4 protein [Methanosarcina acetivorans]|uniref:Hexosyltransferase n=2 Tax=Methanosarcina acetivorans TaxID=2214 RepID=Q8TRI9_METAC|nr:glycosyltransferase family 4 protein [Methanosarcina acetivorans]AAM04607.1 hexosyltransferase [Methanosarcina acetivorans C2A]HIH94922.1 glycosyltransferase family 4 protein [Methanosarcina acetivorans]